MRSLFLVFVWFLAACPGSAGGDYVQSGRQGGTVDRGETNGRRLDFISNKPDQEDWQIRVTGSSMWVSQSKDDTSDKLGSFNLTDKETTKLWNLVDAVDIPNRKRGKKDEDEGYVSLQLKDPDSDGVMHHCYISRATDDEELISLATYLQDLTLKYKKRKPKF